MNAIMNRRNRFTDDSVTDIKQNNYAMATETAKKHNFKISVST